MGDRQSIHLGNRPIASGLLIAIAGSPLGVLSIVLVMAAGELITTQKWSKIAGLFRTFFDTLLPFSYIFGGIPAVLAGLLIGVALYRNGWVGWAYWIVVTFSLGIAAIFIADLIGVLKMRLFQPDTALFRLDMELVAFFVGPTLFASLVLRWVIIWLGWMRRPDSPTAS